MVYVIIIYKKVQKFKVKVSYSQLITCNNNLTHTQNSYSKFCLSKINKQFSRYKGQIKIKSGCVHIYKEGNNNYEP